MAEGLLWWARRMSNGAVYVERYFSAHELSEARCNVSVVRVVGPFGASNLQHALDIAKSKMT